jgi:hypothetical protein
LLVVSTAFLFRFVNGELSARMESFKNESLAYLEQQVNGRIYYDSISPSIFMFLEVRNFRISPFDSPDAFILKLKRITIHYNIFKLIFSTDPLKALTEIKISDSSLSLDVERDRDVVQLLNNLLESSPSSQETRFVKISGARLSLKVYHPEGEFDAQDIFFELDRVGDQHDLHLKNAKIVANFKWPSGQTERVETSVRLKAKLKESFEWIDSQLRINSLTTRRVALNRQTFHVSYHENVLEITKIKDKSPIDLFLYLNNRDRRLTVNFQSQNLSPSDLFTFRGEWEDYNKWLNAEISGNGKVSLELESGKIEYDSQLAVRLSNNSLPGEVRFNSRFTGNERFAYISHFAVQTSTGDLRFAGNIDLRSFLPKGSLYLEDVELLPNIALDASLRIDRNNGLLSLRSDKLSIGNLEFGATAFHIEPGSRAVSFDLISSIVDEKRHNSIRLEGNASMSSDLRLSVQGAIKEVPLKDVLLLHSAKQAATDASAIVYPLFLPEYFLSAEFYLTTNFSSLDLQIASCELATAKYLSARSSPGIRGDAPASLSKVSATAKSGLLNYHSLSGFTSMVYSADKNETGFSALFNLNGFDYYLSGTHSSETGFSFSGSYDIDGYFKRAANGFSFSLATNRLPVPIKDPPIWLSLDLSASKGDRTEWLVASSDSTLHNFPIFASRENTLQIAGDIYGSSFALRRIFYEDEFSSLAGDGRLLFRNLNDFRGQAGLRSEDSAENYSLRIEVNRDEIDLRAEFLGVPLSRLYRSSVSGLMQGEVSVLGSIEEPLVLADLELQEGRWITVPIHFSTQLSYQRGRLVIGSFDADYLKNKVRSTNVQLDLEEGRFSLNSILTVDLLGSTSMFNLSVEASVPKERLSLSSHIIWDKLKAVARIKDIVVDDKPASDWQMALRSEDDTLYFDGGPQDSIHGTVSSNLEFSVSLSSPLPIKGEASGAIVDDQISADFPYIEIDFPLLTVLLGEDVFKFIEGTAAGNLSISGMITDPDFFGTLDAQDVRIGFYMAPDTSELFDTQLVFTEKELYFGVIDTKAGDTDIHSEGTLILSHWGPESYDLHFWTTDPVGLHLVWDFGNVYTDGYAAGRVRVMGDWNNTRLEGKLQINYCKITLGEDTSEEQEVDDELALFVELDLEAGKRVEFLWPSISFPVLRTNAALGSKLFISYDSGAVDMSIQGDVELKGGEVFYFDRSFYFRTGLIRFNETIDSFDPHLNVRAEIRERDENDEEVKIFLIVENERLSEFSPRFHSEPSKSDVEIVALLGGPIQDQFAQSGFGYSALMLSSDFVSQFGIVRPFEQSVRDVLGLDQFSIRTRVIQNVVFDRVLGIENTGVQYQTGSPGSYFNNTTVAFGKYIGNDLFLEALVRFHGGAELGLQTEILLSIEWPTPFFNLEWTVSPSLEGLEDILLRNNTLTFSWLYSY